MIGFNASQSAIVSDSMCDLVSNLYHASDSFDQVRPPVRLTATHSIRCIAVRQTMACT